jgi:hypothetical protein
MFTDLADHGPICPQATSYNILRSNKHIILYLKLFSSMIMAKTL